MVGQQERSDPVDQRQQAIDILEGRSRILRSLLSRKDIATFAKTWVKKLYLQRLARDFSAHQKFKRRGDKKEVLGELYIMLPEAAVSGPPACAPGRQNFGQRGAD